MWYHEAAARRWRDSPAHQDSTASLLPRLNIRAADAGFHRVARMMRVRSLGGVELGRCCGLSPFLFVLLQFGAGDVAA